ncbi:MAG TPA: 30S ribosomal protein S8 [Aggregatilineales bacterium]|jgi:small subunit ribosomal protein S8|nr:30S ribosomal protein S8 [Aggregatilineales bacterium]
MVNDPIADMLTRIRNALMAGKSDVSFPKSKLKVEIVRILKEEGYIEDYAIGEETPVPLVNIKLKYHGARRQRRPVITNISRISKPGRRVYRNRRDLPRVLSGTGIAIVTTPKGVMTAAQARRERVGGEVLCYVW